MIPLQAPHDECYRCVEPSVNDDVWWAVGGQKGEPATKKIEATRLFRAETGDEAWIHGLGFGVIEELAKAVRADPKLLDSIDNSTGTNGSIGSLPGVKEKMTIVAARATAARLKDLRALTPFAEAKAPNELRDSNQRSMEDTHEERGLHPQSLENREVITTNRRRMESGEWYLHVVNDKIFSN